MTDPDRNHEIQRPDTEAEETDLRELFSVLWAGKWVIGGMTFTTTVIAVIIALMLPNIYRADALLAPNNQETGVGLSARASQFGGLASLAGINIGSGATDKIMLGLEVLKSRKFISEFIVRHNILIPLMAVDGWDSETAELEIDSSAYDVTNRKWIRKVSPPKKVIPTLQEAYEVFMDNLSVTQDKKSGFVSIAIEHYSPNVAKEWVDWLIEDINLKIMSQDVAEAKQTIDYLNEQITNTSLKELKLIFFRLVEEQMKTVILAAVSDEYLLKTVDPAVAPEKKAGPVRTLIVLVSIVLGGFMGIIVHLVLSNRASLKQEPSR